MMLKKRSLQIALYLSLATSLVTCKMYKEPKDHDEIVQDALPTDVQVPEFWEAPIQDTLAPVEDWYLSFEDPDLNALVEEAIDTTNLPILLKLAEIDFAQASVNLSKTPGRLQGAYGGVYDGLTTLDAGGQYDVSAGLNISWEADLWGKIKVGVLSAEEGLKNKMFDYDFTRQSIAAAVSSSYFGLGALNQKLAMGYEFLDLNNELLELLRQRQDVGIIDMQQVYLAQAQINAIKNTIASFENRLQLTTRDLEVLLGRYPQNDLSIQWNYSELDPLIQVSNPIDLVSRRPDLKAAESRVRQLFYLSEQVRLTKYPSLTLSASPGISNVGELVLGSGASLLGPLFNGGAIDARIDQANALQKQAAIAYGVSMLNAFNEVESSLESAEILLNQSMILSARIQDMEQAYELTLANFEIGKKDLFEVIQIQSQWLLAELDLISIQEAIYLNRIQLYKALGGNISTQP